MKGASTLTEEEQQAVLDRVAADPVTRAREDVRAALMNQMRWRWPWTRAKRRDALILAFDRMLDVFANRIEGSAGYIVAGPHARMSAQQGRHEVRIDHLERDVEAENERHRATERHEGEMQRQIDALRAEQERTLDVREAGE